MSKRLLIVAHAPSENTLSLRDAVERGARSETGIEVRVVAPLQAGPDDVLAAQAVILGTTENLGYMSGALKHVFDSTFLAIGGSLAPDGSAAPVGGSTTDRPFGLYVHGRYDTTGAVRSVLSITGALGWRQAFGVLEVIGEVGEDSLAKAYELGATLAAVVGDSDA